MSLLQPASLVEPCNVPTHAHLLRQSRRALHVSHRATRVTRPPGAAANSRPLGAGSPGLHGEGLGKVRRDVGTSEHECDRVRRLDDGALRRAASNLIFDPVMVKMGDGVRDAQPGGFGETEGGIER